MNGTKIALVGMGLTTVLVAGTGVAYAANGGSFLLGRSNGETATAVLSNTGTGAALSLKTHSARTPTLVVSNSTKIARLNADEVDGLSASAFQRRVSHSCGTGTAIKAIGTSGTVSCTATGVSYQRVIVVHPGATAAAGGTALLAAGASASTLSASGPVLIVVEPGTYDLAGTPLVLSAGVDLRGSGADATHITFEPVGSNITAVVSNGDTVADLSIAAADAGSNGAVALGAQSASSVAQNLILTATSPLVGSTAGLFALAPVRALNVSTSAPLAGVLAQNVVVTYIDGKATGTSYAGFASGASGGVDFVASEVDAATSGAKCIASYNASFTALTGTCA